MITDEADKTIVFLKSYRLKSVSNFFAYKLLVKDFLDNEDLLQGEFDKVSIGIASSNSTMVPLDYFDENHLDTYYKFNQSYENSGNFYADTLTNINSANVFSVDGYINAAIDSRFQNYKLSHALSFLIDSLVEANQLSMDKKLYINVQRKHADIICINDSKLQFCNTYHYETPEDFLYFVLNAGKQTDFDFKNDAVVLLGDITSDHPQYQLLQKYAHELKKGTRPMTNRYCNELDVLPTHYNYNLFSIK